MSYVQTDIEWLADYHETDISISASDELKSIDLSIGSFKQTSPCLLGRKAHKIVLSSPW